MLYSIVTGSNFFLSGRTFLFLANPAGKFCPALAALRKKIIGSILEVLSSLGDVAVKNFPTQQKSFTQTYPRLFPGKMVRKKKKKKKVNFFVI
jgi:hypothetical protein